MGRQEKMLQRISEHSDPLKIKSVSALLLFVLSWKWLYETSSQCDR